MEHGKARVRGALLASIGFFPRDVMADEFGVTEQTIADWEALDDMPVSMAGRTPLYDLEAVRAWLKKKNRKKVAANARSRRRGAAARRRAS